MFRSILIIFRELLNINKANTKHRWIIKYLNVFVHKMFVCITKCVCSGVDWSVRWWGCSIIRLTMVYIRRMSSLYFVSQHDTHFHSFHYIYLTDWLTARIYPFGLWIILFAICLEIILSFCINSSRCTRTWIHLRLGSVQQKPK
jgi:hypothetical protein